MKASNRALPILTLLAITTVLPELFTGSTSIIAFLNPGTVFFLLLGYGLAVLLVRELAVRCHCGVLGLFFLGLGYSILNEGLFAKTLVVDTALPINQYDHYGYVLGVSFPWLAGIAAWHAIASVTIPILITHFLFPEMADKRWVGGKTAIFLSVLLMALGCACFLGPNPRVKGTGLQLGVLLAIMFICFLLGARFKHSIESAPVESRIKPILLGFSVIIPFWGLVVLAAAKVPVVIFFLIWAAVIAFYAWMLKRCHWLTLPGVVLFGLGWYLHNIFQSVLLITLAMHNPAIGITTLVVDAAIVVALYRMIAKCLNSSSCCKSIESTGESC